MTIQKRTRLFPRHADNRLLELVKQFKRHRARIDALCLIQDRCNFASPEYIRADRETSDLVTKCWRIREAVACLPTRTAEGLRAKAWLALWETCEGIPEDGPPDGMDTAVAWSLAVDVAERAVT
jgi:hypothetical protein